MRLKNVVRVISSAAVDFCFLTLFSAFYCNILPVDIDPDGVTFARYPPNKVYSQWGEGFGGGRTNNEGYNNLYDFNGTPPVILVMGSSQMEAFQVRLSETAASQLNRALGENSVYNTGFSGHQFLASANNFDAAMDKYRPNRFVVIETREISFPAQDVADAIRHEYKITVTPHIDDIIGLLRRNPYLRQMIDRAHTLRSRAVSETAETERKEADEADSLPLLKTLLANMRTTAEQSGVKIIVLYDPPVALNDDGTLRFTDDRDAVEQFRALCEEQGISFLDMRERFSSEYMDTYILPYGFVNTSVGSGHLNRYGHAMIADELYQLIGEVE